MRARLDYGLLLALVLPLLAFMPLLTHAGLPNTADGPAHLMRQVELNQAWQEGNLYPRWGTDLALGHGMPIFSYAPPLLYQLTQIFHLTGLPLDEAMKGVLVLDFLLYSAGMFLFARRIFGPGPALVAAALYVYAPYRLREAYIQGNYGQFTGLAFYPLICWAFHGLITDGRPRYFIAAALSLAGLLFSHNISTMLFMPLLAAYILWLLAGAVLARRTRPLAYPPLSRLLLRTAGAGLLGLGLAAIFWLPAFGERHEIKLEGITQGFFDFRENFIHLAEFVAWPQPLDLAAINPEFPLSLGLPQLIGAGLGLLSLALLLLRPTTRVTGQTAGHTLFFALFLGLYTFLALPVSQGVWEAVPLLELAEFPWRMLGPAIFCAAFLAAPAAAVLPDLWPASWGPTMTRLRYYAVAAAILVIIGLNAYYLYPSQFIPWGTPTPADTFAYEVSSGAIGTTSTGEFLPRAAQQHPQPDSLWPDYQAGRPPQKLDPATLPPGATSQIISHRAEADIIEIDTPQAFTATLRTLYWPGWQVYLNGQPVPFSLTPRTGLIQTAIPPGRHRLTLILESTPLRTAGRWLTGLSFLGLGASAVWVVYKGRSRPARPDAAAAPTPISARLFIMISLLLLGTYFLSRPLAPWFTLRSDPNRPQPADRILQVDFGQQIRLVGLDHIPDAVPVGPDRPGRLTATVYWRALQELDRNYSVFLHLDAPDGRTMATVDEPHPEDIPTRNWPPGLYLRNLLQLDIPPDIPPIRYDLNVGLYDREQGQRLVISETATTFKLGPVWVTAPRPALPAEPLARFGPHISLWQASYDPAGPELTLYWQTEQPLTQDYTIFIHLLDQSGNLLAQADGVPYQGLYPPAHWQPGQVVIDRRPLPANPEAGPVQTLAVGLYEPATGRRLPATNNRGQALAHDSFLIPARP